MKFKLPKINGREVCLICDSVLEGQYCLNCGFQAYFTIEAGKVVCSCISYNDTNFYIEIDLIRDIVHYRRLFIYEKCEVLEERAAIKPTKLSSTPTKKWILNKLSTLNALEMLK